MRCYDTRTINTFIIDPSGMGEHYVYCYVDPTNDEMFYVGKGKGGRYLWHLREKPIPNRTNFLKWHKIQQLIANGQCPKVFKLIQYISECKAYRIEQELIGSIGTIKKGSGPLTNMVTEGWALYEIQNNRE
jgi:hypothetical protein